MVELAVTLRPDVARALSRGAPDTPESEQLVARAEELGVSLSPVHPSAEDPLLLPHFHTQVADESAAQRVAAALRESPAVEGAFVKPDAQLPS